MVCCGSQAVAVAITLLQMTAAAGHFLHENRLYKSFRLLQRVRESLPEKDSSEDASSRCSTFPHFNPSLTIYVLLNR